MAVWSKVALSALATGLRCDPEYYQPRYLAYARRLQTAEPTRLGDMADVTDGIHASPEEVETGGVRYLSAKCVKDNHFVLADALQISEAQHSANPRTSLRADDVLLTTVGTIGNAAVVQSEIVPANSDRHLGIVRLRDDAPIDPYYLATFLNSSYGRFQSLREATGNVQLNLFIEKIRELLVPILPCAVKVTRLTRAAYASRLEATDSIRSAEELLLHAVGLDRVSLSASKTYTRRLADLLAEGRFDAEYFSPRYQRVIASLRENGQELSEVASLAERVFSPGHHPKDTTFNYIEIGSLSGDGDAEATTLEVSGAPSRATWIVKSGDVITSTVRPIRRLSALIRDEQDGCVCSSGFAVLETRQGDGGIEPEVLLTYLRLPIICEILDLNTTASMYPTIPLDRLMRLPIVVPDKRTRTAVVSKVRDAMRARERGLELLEQAKGLIDKAIGPASVGVSA